MNRATKRLVFLMAALVVAFIVLSDSLFIVDQTQQVIVRQFGDPVRTIESPGLKVKLPFIQDVIYLDRRVLDLSPPGQQATLNDQKRIEVDAFALYRIADPLKFLRAFQAPNPIENAQMQLNDTINSTMREVLATYAMTAVLSDKRTEIMAQIKASANKRVADWGIELLDVRIRRADLPDETSQAVFARMRSEREREAASYRSQGQETSQQIRAEADRNRTVILAQAQRDAQIARGEGEREALRIMGDAASKDPQFYAFYRSLEAYRESLKPNNTAFLLSPKSDFFKYLETAP